MATRKTLFAYVELTANELYWLRHSATAAFTMLDRVPGGTMGAGVLRDVIAKIDAAEASIDSPARGE